MSQLPLTPRNKQRAWTTILHIAKTNGFPLSLLTKFNIRILHKISSRWLYQILKILHRKYQWLLHSTALYFEKWQISFITQISKFYSDSWIPFITYYIHGLTTSLQKTKVALNRLNVKHIIIYRTNRKQIRTQKQRTPSLYHVYQPTVSLCQSHSWQCTWIRTY